MAVEKMEYLSVYGKDEQLLRALAAILSSDCFEPDDKQTLGKLLSSQDIIYEPLPVEAKSPLAGMEESEVRGIVSDHLKKYEEEVARVNKKRTTLENEINSYQKAKVLLQHMTTLDIDFDDLFHIDYIKIRIGRLPKEGYTRLLYYAEKELDFTKYFNFSVYDVDGDDYWGIYFVTRDKAKEIDELFNSVHFERMRVPEFVHGDPEHALTSIENKITQLQKELEELKEPSDVGSGKEREMLSTMKNWLSFMDQLHDMERYVIVLDNTFYIAGFVPEDSVEKFKEIIMTIDGVEIKQASVQEEDKLPVSPPIKLKNNWFAKPYEMFTTMYGLPSYHDIDPTFIVSVLYSVLYGIMFADFGQGIILALFGYFYMYKKRQMPIGAILARAGVFSALFGFLFGSVFGYEGAFDGVWTALGFAQRPIDVLSPNGITQVLICSVAIGVVVIIFAITLGIISKLKRGFKGEAVTSANGVAGLVFYIGIVGLLVDKVVLKNGFSSNIAYILLTIVLPLLVMYVQEPLAEVIDGKKPHIESVSDLLVGGFFELFVTILEFVSNTVSFLRVGGFVLAHAGMMSVVSTLAQMAGGASVVVMILGNIFIIVLEGLIVGIQALRLNYYELFSRFYDADGVPFKPVALKTELPQV